MPLEPALLSYAGLACLALATHRLRREAGLAALPAVRTLRFVAAAILTAAAWRAVADFGPYQGPVAFIGMLCVAGLPLVLLLSRWPRASLATGIGAAIVALATMAAGLL